MLRIVLKSKIHGARVTRAEPDYEGSLTLDRALLDAAGLVPFEQIHVLNRSNGSRIETYVIPGRRGSGEVCLNGPAARHGLPGDPLVILAYGVAGPEDGTIPQPRIVRVDDRNRPRSAPGRTRRRRRT